jgi:DNA-binding ferritin-like protein
MIREALTHLLKEEREVITLAQHGGDEVTAQTICSLMGFQEEALWHLRSSLRRTAFEAEYLPRASE